MVHWTNTIDRVGATERAKLKPPNLRLQGGSNGHRSKLTYYGEVFPVQARFTFRIMRKLSDHGMPLAEFSEASRGILVHVIARCHPVNDTVDKGAFIIGCITCNHN